MFAVAVVFTALVLGASPEQASLPADCAGVAADYEAGLEALARGEEAAALTRFEAVRAGCPAHPHAAEMARLAERKLAQKATASRGPAAGADGGQLLARAELTLLQAAHGMAQGLAFSTTLGAYSAYPTFALVGTLSAVGLVTLLTLEGVTPGMALLTNSATFWTPWVVLATLGTFAPSAFFSPATSLLPTQLATLGATLAAGLLGRAHNPPPGRISLVNSGAFWAGVVTASFLGAYNSLTTQAGLGGVLLSTLAGGTAGYLLGGAVPMSRTRVLVIDAGGAVGALVGVGLGAVLSGNSGRDAGMLYGLALGSSMVAGLSLAAVLTRDMDRAGAPQGPEARLLPLLGPKGERGAALAFSF